MKRERVAIVTSDCAAVEHVAAHRVEIALCGIHFVCALNVWRVRARCGWWVG